jgi:hypothetical protein
MSLDSIARSSADALLEASRSTASAADLEALVRTSRRRRTTRLAAAATSVVVAVVAGLLMSAPQHRQSEPATPGEGQGVIVTVGGSYRNESVIVRDGAESRVFDQFPGGPRLRFVYDVAVDRAAERIAVINENLLQVVSPAGRLLWAERCDDHCLWVHWTPDGDLVLTEYIEGKEPLRHRLFDRDGIAKGLVEFPRGTNASGLSPEGDRVVGVQGPGPGDPPGAELVVVDRDGSDRTPLPRTELPRGWQVVQVAWAPDGRHLGYLATEPLERPDVVRYRLMLSDVDGSHVRQVASLGRCFCAGWSPPSFAWSPDGQSLLVHAVPTSPRPGTHVLSIDGEVQGTPLGGESPLAWGS